MDRSIATRPTLDQWIRHHLAARALSRRTLLGSIGGLTGLTLLGCSSGGSGGTTAPARRRARRRRPTDTSGRVTFNTIYPGWYPGRATHIHFRVYLGLALQATSQLAFPSATTSAVYSTPLYVARGQNPTTTPSGDGIFSDRVSYQLPIVTANVATGGYDAELTVGIAA
jgi:hypothetical protein